MVQEYGVNSYFTILPETDGIKNMAQTMDVGIVPSHAEAFGRVTVEYQLQNLLVIGNDQGANPELVQSGKTGIIYHKSDCRGLANIMNDVIDNKVDWKNIANAGMLYARQHFLSSYNTQSVYNLYQEIL